MMRVELFLKNGHKLTYDNVKVIKSEEALEIHYEKKGEGDWTTQDEPYICFSYNDVDMLKVVFP